MLWWPTASNRKQLNCEASFWNSFTLFQRRAKFDVYRRPQRPRDSHKSLVNHNFRAPSCVSQKGKRRSNYEDHRNHLYTKTTTWVPNIYWQYPSACQENSRQSEQHLQKSSSKIPFECCEDISYRNHITDFVAWQYRCRYRRLECGPTWAEPIFQETHLLVHKCNNCPVISRIVLRHM